MSTVSPIATPATLGRVWAVAPDLGSVDMGGRDVAMELVGGVFMGCVLEGGGVMD